MAERLFQTYTEHQIFNRLVNEQPSEMVLGSDTFSNAKGLTPDEEALCRTLVEGEEGVVGSDVIRYTTGERLRHGKKPTEVVGTTSGLTKLLISTKRVEAILYNTVTKEQFLHWREGQQIKRRRLTSQTKTALKTGPRKRTEGVEAVSAAEGILKSSLEN